MSVCALFLGLLGMVLSFLPQEVASYLGWPHISPILLQMLGAVYVGFAMMNWTGKANLLGGIYGKPMALGNFTHFAIGALALIKWVFNSTPTTLWMVLTAFYTLFSIIFGYILFTHPKQKSKNKPVTNPT
jgi:predicted DNA repair protein MutK